jgi:uncharacterized protein (TIGR03083 family)
MQHLGEPLDARPYFGPERSALLATLEGLDGDDWLRPTACPGWSVGDIAGHLMGDDLNRLARSRDGWEVLARPDHQPLPLFLAHVNEQWVAACRRLSPTVVVGMLRWSGDEIDRFWREQDLHAPGGQVSWAGPGPAPVWLDAARDLSEYWIHRRQILDALDRNDDTPEDRSALVLATLVRGLPHALSQRPRPVGTTVTVIVGGRGGGAWSVSVTDAGWSLLERPLLSAETVVELDAETAWRLWTRGIEPLGAACVGRGDEDLVTAVREMVSIVR